LSSNQPPPSPITMSTSTSTQAGNVKLHGHILSTCTQRVLFAAGEKNVKVDLQTVNLMTGEQKSPAHLAREPFGKSPVWEDGSFSLFESRAIVQYLDARFATSGTKLVPTDVQQRAIYDQWLFVEAGTVSEPLTAIMVQRVWGPMRPHFTFDENKLKAAVTELDGYFTILDAQLTKTGAFLTGRELSAVDIFFTPYLALLSTLPAEKALFDSHAPVKEWFNRITSRPAWQNVHQQVMGALAAMKGAHGKH